jgi:hypothetical protein
LELIDPSGVQLHGVKNYKAAFRMIHAIVGIFYCPERSLLTFRMCFDKARQNIRIHWNAQVIPKAIFGGEKTTLHVDGISVYELCRNSGNITQHRIEQLVINDMFINPEQGIFAALRGHAVKSNVDSIPVFNMIESSETTNQILSFSPASRSRLFPTSTSSGEKDNEKKQPRSSSIILSSSSLGAADSNNNNSVDWEAYDKKNAARKKFGLDPLTPEEFVDLQEQVAELDTQQRLKQRKQATAAAAEIAQKKKQEEDGGGFFKKLFGQVLQDTCDSNYDCQRPEVCCDFGFKKMCCTSGMRIVDGPNNRQGQLAEVPVLIDPNPYPPQQPYPRGNYNGY